MNTKRKIILSLVIIAIVGVIGILLANAKKSLTEEANMSDINARYIPVTATQVNNEDVNDSILATGNLEADKNLTFLSETQGRVVRIYKETGDFVRKGQIIASIDNELQRSETVVAQANYIQEKKDLSRYARLNKGEAITKHQYEQASLGVKKAKADLITIRKQLRNTTIIAPISGTISNDDLVIGTLLSPGSKICDITDISRLKLLVKVTESEVLRLNKGERALIKLNALPTASFYGNIKSIGVKADDALRYDVEITINKNPGQRLKAGMYANAIFIPKTHGRAMMLDRNAIIGSLQNPSVYVIKNNMVYERPIIIGRIIEDKVEVLKGLSESDLVVSNGQTNLSEGAKIKIIK